jgi:heme exporter protein B
MLLQEIKYLIKKDLLLEWRKQHVISGTILYVATTVFVSYLSFTNINNKIVWNALFWIIVIFSATNAATKSFFEEEKDNKLFSYLIASPQSIILSKIIYNQIFIIVLTFVTYIIYSILNDNPVENQLYFIIAVILSSGGIASALTMVAAISSAADNNSSMIAILGFPIIMPLIITAIKFSKSAMDGFGWDINNKYILILLALNVIIVMLSYLLFPYLWRD